MSDRLDVVVIRDQVATIHHQRWGATALYDTLLKGPVESLVLIEGFEATSEVTDILAGCVVDLDARVLLIAGEAEVITAAGARRPPEHEVLAELAPAWPGFVLRYEPRYVTDAVVLYVRGLGLPLASLNEPHALSGALKRTHFVEPAYRASGEGASPPVTLNRAPADPNRKLDLDSLSIRAANELDNAGLLTVGSVAGKSETELASAGISSKVFRELSEYLAELSET